MLKQAQELTTTHFYTWNQIYGQTIGATTGLPAPSVDILPTPTLTDVSFGVISSFYRFLVCMFCLSRCNFLSERHLTCLNNLYKIAKIMKKNWKPMLSQWKQPLRKTKYLTSTRKFLKNYFVKSTNCYIGIYCETMRMLHLQQVA